MTEDRKKITVFMTESRHRTLKVDCAALGITMNEFINNAITEKLERKKEDMSRPKEIK